MRKYTNAKVVKGGKQGNSICMDLLTSTRDTIRFIYPDAVKAAVLQLSMNNV